MELKYLMNKMKNGIESIKIIYKTEEGASEIEERNFEITYFHDFQPYFSC